MDITEAIAEFDGAGGAIAAPPLSTSGGLAGSTASEAGLLYIGGQQYATMVNFDIAITYEDADASKAGGGIKVIPFRVGAETSSTQANTTVSRVQFAIPLKLS